MDHNEVFRRIVRFIVDAHRDMQRGRYPSTSERKAQIERFVDLAGWTDRGGAHPDPIVSDGRRWTWNAFERVVESTIAPK